jgi:hypothetical protein
MSASKESKNLSIRVKDSAALSGWKMISDLVEA